MRPPQNAGENLYLGGEKVLRVVASMRPPQNAGENGGDDRGEHAQAHGFNEAPAECGGKPPIATTLYKEGGGLQ